MREAIYQHGTLERFAKAIAQRFGWEAECKNCDIDPLSGGLYAPKAPGRGDMVLSRDGHGTSFEYELPEDPDIIAKTIQQCVEGFNRDQDRALGKGAGIEIGD